AATGMSGDEQPAAGGDENNRTADEQNAGPRRGRDREDAEGEAGGAAVHQVGEVADQVVAPTFGRVRFAPGLAGPVAGDNPEGKPQPTQSSGNEDQRGFS